MCCCHLQKYQDDYIFFEYEKDPDQEISLFIQASCSVEHHSIKDDAGNSITANPNDLENNTNSSQTQTDYFSPRLLPTMKKILMIRLIVCTIIVCLFLFGIFAVTLVYNSWAYYLLFLTNITVVFDVILVCINLFITADIYYSVLKHTQAKLDANDSVLADPENELGQEKETDKNGKTTNTNRSIEYYYVTDRWIELVQVFYGLTLTFGLVATFSFWALLAGSVEWNYWGTSIHNVNSHGTMFFIILFDYFYSAHNLKYKRLIFIVVFGFSYAFFNIIYVFSGGKNHEGYEYIYGFLDWKNSPGIAVIMFMVVVFMAIFSYTGVAMCKKRLIYKYSQKN